MMWSDEHCILLCHKILAVDPFTGTRKGSIQRGANWKAIADNLMAIEKPKFKVDARAVREKYAYLAGKLRNKLKEEEKASGIDTEMTEVEEALQEIIEIEDEAERAQKEGSDEKKKNENADRAQAETMRKRAMESLGESLGNKGDDKENEKKRKKKRSNGSDTLMFLREKNEMMQEMKKQEMQLKKKEMELQDKKHDDFLKVMLGQQQQLQQQQQDFHDTKVTTTMAKQNEHSLPFYLQG